METSRLRRTGRVTASIVLRVVVPLTMGAGVYLLRSQPTVADGWANAVGMHDAVTRLRSLALVGAEERAPRWLLGTLPDALWAFVVAQSILLIWSHGSRAARLFWSSLGLCLVLGWELGQALHVVRGTFDVRDLLASAAAYALALIATPSSTLRIKESV